jgi:hypothetical protein
MRLPDGADLLVAIAVMLAMTLSHDWIRWFQFTDSSQCVPLGAVAVTLIVSSTTEQSMVPDGMIADPTKALINFGRIHRLKHDRKPIRIYPAATWVLAGTSPVNPVRGRRGDLVSRPARPLSPSCSWRLPRQVAVRFYV